MTAEEYFLKRKQRRHMFAHAAIIVNIIAIFFTVLVILFQLIASTFLMPFEAIILLPLAFLFACAGRYKAGLVEAHESRRILAIIIGIYLVPIALIVIPTMFINGWVLLFVILYGGPILVVGALGGLVIKGLDNRSDKKLRLLMQT